MGVMGSSILSVSTQLANIVEVSSNTTPGLSINRTLVSNTTSCKHVVKPGRALTPTARVRFKALMILLFPVLGYPTIPTTIVDLFCFLLLPTPVVRA